MSKVNGTGQGVTYVQRETTLKMPAMKATLGIGQVHAEYKADYNTYIGDRRALMTKYIQALYKTDGGTAAKGLASQIQQLDAKYSSPRPRDSKVIKMTVCFSLNGGPRSCFTDVETRTTVRGLKTPAVVTHGIYANKQCISE